MPPSTASSSMMVAISVVDETHSMPHSRKMRWFLGLFTRAITRGTLKTRVAISHDTRLASSLPVVDTNTSARRMSASSWKRDMQPSPQITR